MFGSTARTQVQQRRRVRLVVVEVSGRSVYFDKGKSDGLRPGTQIRVFPTGGQRRDVRLLVASSRSARLDWPLGVALPAVGDRAEARVVADSTAAAKGTGSSLRVLDAAAPEHPPWLTDDSVFTPDTPLLAPARSRRREQRPTVLRGRFFGHYQYQVDRGGARESAYQFGRLGAEVEANNPFGHGGDLYLEADIDRRGTDLLREGDSGDTRTRLDRLSYAVGNEAAAPYRAEFGRFISHSVPELGWLDGIEAFARTESGLRLGIGAGAVPEPFPDGRTGDDLGLHLFAELEPTLGSPVSGMLAFQKTWHKGRKDRDQILGRFEFRPDDAWSIWSSFRFDIYDTSDRAKKSGIELTEFWAQGDWRSTANWGLGMSVSRYRWADTRRDEFLALPPAMIRDAQIDRVDLSTWCEFTENIRVRLRGDYWEDQSSHGSNAEISLDLSEFLDPSGFLFISGHHTEALYASGPTYRVRYSRRLGSTYLSIGYDASLLEAGGSAQRLHRHVLRCDVDFALADRWDTSIGVERTLGDSEDGYSLTTFLQYRF